MEFGFYSSTITSPAVTSVVKQHSLMNNSNVLSFFSEIISSDIDHAIFPLLLRRIAAITVQYYT